MGHSGGRIIIHHLSSEGDRLIYSTTVHHPEAGKSNETGEGNAVKSIIASEMNTNVLWTVVGEDPTLYMWRESRLSKKLNCSRIVPVSESLSTINAETLEERCFITQLAIQKVHARSSNSMCNYRERLILGTSRGVVIVVDATELIPLTSFRPFFSHIEHIVICTMPDAGWVNENGSGDVQDNSLVSSVMQQLSQPVNIPSAVSQLISTTSNPAPNVGTFPSPMQDGDQEAFFAVVANGYRCLNERFGSGAPHNVENKRCAIFCRNSW